MPDHIYNTVDRAIRINFVKDMNKALSVMPNDMREMITVTTLPNKDEGLSGCAANLVITDEYLELTKENN